MRSDWRVATFQQLLNEGSLEIGDGYRAQNNELGGSGPIFLRAGHVTDTHIDFAGVEHFHDHLAPKVRTKMSKVGDTVITTKGNSTGRTSFVTDRLPPFVYSPHLSYWRSREPDKLCGGFLRYWSRSVEFIDQLSGMKASTDMAPYLSLTDQRRLSITVPPIAEQTTIAGVLGALDDKIELNRRMNTTLEAIARALFQGWFVDFDPVRAKIDCRQPGSLDSEIADLFPEHFADSALGQIPLGWQVRPIKDVVEGIYDGPHATPPESSQGPVFLGIRNLTGTTLELSDIRHIGENDWAKWTRRVTPRANDIVFSYEATLGYFAVIPPRLECCLGHRLALIRPQPSDGHPHFWFHQFIGSDFQRYLFQHSVQGATVDRIPLADFPNYLALDPPSGLKGAFERRVAPLWAKIHSNAEQSRTLASLRDTLLPKLLSGELNVEDLRS